MKVVIDTNVLIDAWGDDFSYTRKIVDAVISGELKAYASHKVWREYNLILNRLVNNPEHHELANRFFTSIEMVNNGRRVNVVKYDREDNKFFSAAIEAGADYIISNDMDLREVGEYDGIKVLTPDDFWAKFKNRQDESGSEEWKNWMSGVMGK